MELFISICFYRYYSQAIAFISIIYEALVLASFRTFGLCC